MSATESQDHCVHTVLPNGIHELRVEKNTRKAVDDLFRHVDEINKVVTPGELVRVIINHTPSEIIPLSPLMNQMRGLDRSKTPPYRVVVLIEGGTMVQLARAFLKTYRFKHSEVRLMRFDEYEQAVAWLLS